MNEEIKPSTLPGQSDVIVSQTVSGLKYNSQVFQRENVDVVISSDTGVRRLRKIEGGIINPLPQKHRRKDIDAQEYRIYWIDVLKHPGKWGSHFSLRGNEIFVRAEFQYQIVSGERLVSLLPSNSCISEYVLLKILRQLMQRTMTECLEAALNNNAEISALNCHIFQEKINQSILYNCGIEMTDLGIITECKPSETVETTSQTKILEEHKNAVFMEEK